jgi:iron(III) transport system substrate-binding protein
MHTLFRRRALLAALAASTVGLAAPALAQVAVNVYTYREAALIKPLFDAFTADTGIKVNTISAAQGLEQRIASEGQNSPADVLLTVDIGRLKDAVGLGIVQPVRTEALESLVPAPYRDPNGKWYGVSLRGRVVYASKERVKQDAMTYEELADPRWRGKICTRSGQHLYNVGLFAAAVAHMGEAKAEEWLKGVKANLAKKPSGGDREVAKDIAAGVCDIGLGNTYYVALMLTREPDRKPWAEAVKVVLPTFEGGGTHVNISGVAMAKHAPNRDSALKFMSFMTSEQGQQLHADLNFEYPIRKGVPIDETVASFGRLRPDNVAMADIARHRKTASEIVDRIGFDR